MAVPYWHRVGGLSTSAQTYFGEKLMKKPTSADFREVWARRQALWFALKDNFVWVQLEDGADTEAHLHGTIRELVFDNFGWQR